MADRGLIPADNLEHVTQAGFAHTLAARLHRDQTYRDALTAAHRPDQIWANQNHRRWSTDTSTGPDGRAVVVFSTTRRRRDLARSAELVARTETKLAALEKRVNQDGRLAVELTRDLGHFSLGVRPGKGDPDGSSAEVSRGVPS